ncbi:MAG: peptidoglycan bridge formation glycyltransferase FemA/FemB family protein [Planctomycetes bacterium]|nr:peptidoglycan bridge formation glycyltransferase FemA/FemB family protein [Planctomycetota bacterium]
MPAEQHAKILWDTCSDVSRFGMSEQAVFDSLSLAHTDDEFARWDDFVIRSEAGHYTQLHGWLSSYRPMGFEPEVLVARGRDGIIGGAAFLSYSLPLLRGKVFILPHGPVCEGSAQGPRAEILAALTEHFQANNAVFAQVWPHIGRNDLAGLAEFRGAGFTGPRLFDLHEFSSTELRVDLSKSEEHVLSAARRNTRYYGRKSFSTGLTLRLGCTLEDLEESYRLWQENGEYHGYHPRPLSTHKIILDRLVARNKALLIQAWNGDRLAGSILVLFAGRQAVYAQGGIRREFKDRLPAYFMHLSAMRIARERDFLAYDFNNWGTPGTRLFKAGFRPVVQHWAVPATRMYKPVLCRLLVFGQHQLRPVLRRVASWRAGRCASRRA